MWRNTWLTSLTDMDAPRILRAGLCAMGIMACTGATHARPVRHAPPPPPDAAPELLYGLPAACIAHVITAPLLTNSGSPIIPVTFNAMDGLSYLSVTQDRVGVYAATTHDFPVESIIDIQTITGEDTTYTTTLNTLRISNGMAENVPALLEGIGLPHINDRPVLGIIGYDVLGNYDVLFDFPARRMVLFLPREGSACPPMRDWLGADSTALPLLPDSTGRMTGVALRMGEHTIRMEVEPAADISSLSRRDARALGLTSAMLRTDMHVRTNAGKILNGRRHHFDNVTLGSWQNLGLDVNVEKTTYSVLGMNFLRRRRVLMAFPQDMVFMTPQQDMPDDRGQATHGVLSTRTAIARMVETLPPAGNTLLMPADRTATGPAAGPATVPAAH
ncbi:retropepsin-like aspartic protease [Komagataeibacter swingsii]|uniref:Retroviral-like aspartic protease family protein n=1 Tax=Komagataeibacter swingsii TaxID=215220 RepID=A0A850NYX9_9PROT|nr:retropepsin-like aspartic protease [Komagataeibacter swingsii]NVN36143.1 retroviral-like aspartic protease family protein [Komagataeibacter swingsii]